jgi:hypothetical protein
LLIFFIKVLASYHPNPFVLLPPLAGNSYSGSFIAPCKSDYYEGFGKTLGYNECLNVDGLLRSYGIDVYTGYLHPHGGVPDSMWYHDYPFEAKANDLRENTIQAIDWFKNKYPNEPSPKVRIFADSISGIAARSYVTSPEIYANNIDKVCFLHSPLKGLAAPRVFSPIKMYLDNSGWMLLLIETNIMIGTITPPPFGGPAVVASWVYIGITHVSLTTLLSIIYGIAGDIKLPLDESGELYKAIIPDSKDMKKLNSAKTLDGIKYRILAGRANGALGEKSVTVINMIIPIILGSIPYAIGNPLLWQPVLSWFLTLVTAYTFEDGDGLVDTDSQIGEGINDIRENVEFEKIRGATHNWEFSLYWPGLWTTKYKLDSSFKNDLLAIIDEKSNINVEGSNPNTWLKMEPDGAYINIQHPIIHIDGSCDDYLIQWMGDNDRIRLRYDKYANVDEVVHLKNTEEGIFDYQRVGDVGRGWFSQNKNKRKGV